MRRLTFILAHPLIARRFVKACRAQWPTLEVDQ